MSFAPGEAYQFDWSHETITLQNLPLTIKAHMKLSHSRMPFAADSHQGQGHDRSSNRPDRFVHSTPPTPKRSPSPAGPTIELERLVVGVEHQLLGLPEVAAYASRLITRSASKALL
jgi:hypothetical protein